MKIIYLHQYFNTPQMSGGTRSYEMARRLVKSGHEVHVVTSERQETWSSRTWRETVEAGINVHWTPIRYGNQMSYPQRVKAFFHFALRAARRAASLKGDVVFATSTPLTIALPGIYAAKRARAPFVFEVRDLWPELPIAIGALKNRISISIANALESFAYRHARHIVALSPGMRDGILRRGVGADHVCVVPNSCDCDLFDVPVSEGAAFRNQHGWLGEKPLVVYCGTLGLINGVDYLARLAAEVDRIAPEVRFLVVGSGRQKEFIRDQAQSLGVLNKNFFMQDSVAKEAMPRILSAADVATSLFLDVPEMQANSANKFFDALAAGRPLAINHEGWLADLIRERGLGLVFDPHEIAYSARALVEFLQDRQAVERVRAASRQTARELFDRDLLAGRLENVLLAAVGESAAARQVPCSIKKAA